MCIPALSACHDLDIKKKVYFILTTFFFFKSAVSFADAKTLIKANQWKKWKQELKRDGWLPSTDQAWAGDLSPPAYRTQQTELALVQQVWSWPVRPVSLRHR
jgi:hypothetical protein